MNEISSGYAVGDVIQITNPEHHWFPCLLIVEEVRSWGAIAHAYIPLDNLGNVGNAPIRLSSGDFLRVGRAIITLSNDADPDPVAPTPSEGE